MADDEHKQIFAQNLKYFMEVNHVTQMDMMKDLSLPTATISSWVNGIRMPRMEKVQALADYFGIKTSLLIDDWQTEYQDILIHDRSKISFPVDFEKINDSTFEGIKSLIAKNGSKLTQDEKMKLIKILSDL